MKQFVRGERAKLSELAAINHIWEVGVAIDAPFFIVDYCCLGLDANGEVVDNRFLISYNQPDAPDGAISLDNYANNGAIFQLYLEKLPSHIRRLVFTATLHEPEMPGGLVGAAFSLFGIGFDGQVGEGRLTLATPAIHAGEFSFTGENFGRESTLILGEFYWRDEWRFVAAGQVPTGELSAFLSTLTDGPTPFPLPAPVQVTSVSTGPPPLTAPPRPPHVLQVPEVAAPIVIALPPVPSAPVVFPFPTLAKATQVAISFPQELTPDAHLQDLIDATPSGSTLTLMRDEYEGPVIISKPLVLEGRDSALWTRSGPVVTVVAANVTLRNLDIEVTISHNANGFAGIALQVEEQAEALHLDNVRVRGRIGGISEEDGLWDLPESIDLGEFAPRVLNEFHFTFVVPVEVALSSPIEGVSVLPKQIGPGKHQILFQISEISPETLIVGFVELKSAALTRLISLTGKASKGSASLTM